MTLSNAIGIMGPGIEVSFKKAHGRLRYAIARTKKGLFVGSGTVLRTTDSDALKDLVEDVYRARCRRVFERQEWKCARCGKVRPLQGHHKKHRSKGRDDRESNLIGVCASCHEKAHGKH